MELSPASRIHWSECPLTGWRRAMITNGSSEMFRKTFLTTMGIGSLVFLGSANADAQSGHSHHGSRGNSHSNLHQNLNHNEFHRQQYHAQEHQFPQTRNQHFQLHQDLDHDRYHDSLTHQSYHSSRQTYNSYRPSTNSYRQYSYPQYGYPQYSYPQYSSGYGQRVPSYGFSLRIGR